MPKYLKLFASWVPLKLVFLLALRITQLIIYFTGVDKLWLLINLIASKMVTFIASNNSLTLEIDWKACLQHCMGIPADFTDDTAAFMPDESEFFDKLNRYHGNWSVEEFREDLEAEKHVIFLLR